MRSSREITKLFIETSNTVEDANKIIENAYDFETIEEKIAFLKGMFDVELISNHDSPEISKGRSAEMDYWTMLSAIINDHYYN